MLNFPAVIAPRLRHWALALAIGLLAACGNSSGNDQTMQATPAAEMAPATSQTAVAEDISDAAADTVDEAGAATVAEAEPPAAAEEPDVQEQPAPASGGEELKLASAETAPAPANWRYREGRDFKVLTTAQGTTGGPGTIEIAEAFWYGCPHCYQFDPVIQDWAKKQPEDVSFVRLPVTWNPTHQIHARLYYTAMALGKIEEMHSAIFRELHIEGRMLATEKDIQAFFSRFGVSAEEFQKTFRSFAVEGHLKRAKELTERYQIRSVPLLIVNGKYSTDAPGVKSLDDMVAVVSELVERERQR